jgi:hypothetical protein
MEKLNDFSDHLNSINHTQFIMKKWIQSHLPFEDNDVYTRADTSLRCTVHRKPTHTNLCLNTRSQYLLVKKQAVFPPWHTHGPTWTVSTRNWNFSRTPYNIMPIATSRLSWVNT